MAVHGIDLLIARRKANVAAQALARQMGTTRQYVAKLEARDDVTPEAAEMYRNALSALEASRSTHDIEIGPDDTDYYAVRRRTLGAIRGHAQGKTLYNVIAQPTSPWQGVLAVLDALDAKGGQSRIVIAGGEGEPTVLRRIG